MKKRSNPITQQLRLQIEQYFGSSVLRLDISDAGAFHLVSVAYQDFNTEAQVRHDLESMNPCILVGQVDRLYSDRTRQNALDLIVSQWLDRREVRHGLPDWDASPVHASPDWEAIDQTDINKSSTYPKALQ